MTDGQCAKVAGTNTDMSLPLASIFKLYVLLAVAEAVKSGTVEWTDPLTITEEGKALGTPKLDDAPPGSTVTVRDAAQQMISASDNMATDLLIGRLGPGAIERALVLAGHHDPASMTPFPTMHELFSVGWGTPDLREQWKQASPLGRAQLLQQTNSRPYEPDPNRTHTPASDIGAEWYGSAADICRLHAALQKSAVGEAAPVTDILSVVPGIDLDRTKWPYIGAKAGNLPGDLTFSWYAVDHTGQPCVVSFQLNWPQFRSKTAAGWLMTDREAGIRAHPEPLNQGSTAASTRAHEVHDRAACRCDVDAPERLRRRIQCDEDRRPNHRRVGDRDDPASVLGHRTHPAGNPVDQVDDGLAAVWRAGGVGQPDGQLGRQHPAENLTAPPAAVQVGELRFDDRSHAEQFGGLAGALLRPAEHLAGFAEVDACVDLAPSRRVERFVGGKSSGCHRVGHGVRHQGQPDDLTHSDSRGSRRSCPLGRRDALLWTFAVADSSAALTNPMVVQMITCVPSVPSRNSYRSRAG